jgi:multidrug resistance protein, MATE family
MFNKYRFDLADTIRLSLPIIIAQLGVVLMGVTDNLFVGRLLGAVPLGAAGLANSLSILVCSVGLGSLSVVSAQVSQVNARNDFGAVNQLFRAGLQVATLLGLLTCVVSVVLALNFDLFGQTAEVTRLSRDFMLILTASILPLLLFTAARQLGDGLRFPRVAMAITLGALALNALFNYLLILGIGPFPKMGLMGSAMATLLSRLFMAAGILIYIYQSANFKSYFQAAFAKLPTRHYVLDLLRLGLPGGLTFMFEIALFSLAALMIGWLGENQLAAHQIAINLASTTYMVATGISATAAIRVGAAMGRQNQTEARRAGIAAFLLITGIMAVFALVFFTANDWLVSLYIRDNAEVAQIATSLVIMGGFFQLSDGIQVVGVGSLRGLADVNIPTWMTLFSYWVVALPLSYLLEFTFGLGVIGVWIGLLVGLTVAAVLLTIRFFKLVRQ